MKSVMMLIFVSCSLSYASQQSASLSADHVNDSRRDLAYQVDALLRANLQDTQLIRRAIREVLDAKKRVSHDQENEHLVHFLNELSVKWATVLITLSTKNSSSQTSLDEIALCITHLSNTIESDLETIQQAWSRKQSLGRKSQSVSSQLSARKITIDELVAEEQQWNSRQLQASIEIKDSPEPLPRVSPHTHTWYQSLQIPMDGIRKLLTESMSTVQKNSAPTEDEYGSAEDSGSQGQGLERAQESHQLIEELARYIEWNLERLARPSQDGEPSTLEEIQADMGILLNDLDMHALLALRAICGYRMTLERIQANRQAYARYRNTESTVFDCEHSRLKIQQTERLTLLARLKLLHMKYDQGGKKHLLSDEEIKLLVTYKEELSPDEQTAIAKLQPGFLSRIKSFMS